MGVDVGVGVGVPDGLGVGVGQWPGEHVGVGVGVIYDDLRYRDMTVESAVWVPVPITRPSTEKLTEDVVVEVFLTSNLKVTVWLFVLPGKLGISQTIFLFVLSITGGVLLYPFVALPTT